MTSELERKISNRFGQLPHAVVDDRRVSAGSLALLAYRTLYIGEFRLHHRDVRGKFARGLGEDAFHRELRALKTVGYINRWQPRRGDGDYARAVENVNLTVAPKGRQVFQKVPQTVFNGSLSANEVAALVFLRSHAPNYPVYVRCLAERFGWGQKMASRVLAQLAKKGHVKKVQQRYPTGEFAGIVYSAHGTKANIPPVYEKPGTPISEARKSGAYITLSGTHQYLRQNPNGISTARRFFEAACPGRLEYEDLWMDSIEPNFVDAYHGHYYNNSLREQIEACADDDTLMVAIFGATDGRIGKKLRSPDLLVEFRQLAACILGEYGCEGEHAVDALLQEACDVIGSKPGKYLNSLALLGVHVFVKLHSGMADWHALDDENGTGPGDDSIPF